MGNDNPAYFGTLSFDVETGLRLIIKIPKNRSQIEAFRDYVTRKEIPRLIYGTDENNNPISLFGCLCSKAPYSRAFDDYEITCVAALTNSKAETWNDRKFFAAAVRYNLLHIWLHKPSFKSAQTVQGESAIAFSNPADIQFDLFPDVRLRIERTLRSSSSIAHFHSDFDHRVWFHFSRPCTIEEAYNDFIGVFLRFFAVLTGERIFAKEVLLFEGDPFTKPDSFEPKELLQAVPGIQTARTDIHGMITQYANLASRFETITKRWFELHAKFEPIVDLLLLVHSECPLTETSRFLFMAQALEVYHARSGKFSSLEMDKEHHKLRSNAILEKVPAEHQKWLKEKLAYLNQKTLSQRIEEVLSLYPSETKSLTNSFPDFAKRVRYTRNYLTHYPEDLRKAGKIAEGKDLIKMAATLQALLHICLLRELGIDGEPIREIVSRSTSLDVISVSEESLAS